MKPSKPVVFVSCGQSTETEKKLGSDVVELVGELRPDLEAYFAQNESNIEGLSTNILQAIYHAAAFICIMHGRGEVFRGANKVSTRGSVWIEQEIAILAFMAHVLDRKTSVLFYVQKGLSIEGVRQVLQLNPRLEFTDESQILAHLRGELPSLTATPIVKYDVMPEIRVQARGITSERHDYVLHATVKNTGQRAITDFQLEVHFPSRFLNPNVTYGAVERKSDNHHIFVKRNQPGVLLYPGQRIGHGLTIEYSIDNGLSGSGLSDTVVVKLFSGDMPPKIFDFDCLDPNL